MIRTQIFRSATGVNSESDDSLIRPNHWFIRGVIRSLVPSIGQFVPRLGHWSRPLGNSRRDSVIGPVHWAIRVATRSLVPSFGQFAPRVGHWSRPLGNSRRDSLILVPPFQRTRLVGYISQGLRLSPPATTRKSKKYFDGLRQTGVSDPLYLMRGK